jgi:CRP/FNR family transcriptional regulator
MDIRLAQKLLQLKNAQGDVEATHQQLATELGTAREVISRQLQEFQRRGWLKNSRGIVSVPPDSPLHEFARGHAP